MQDLFIKRLVELMEEKDMSQTRLSNLIGTTNVTISRYISGQRKPRLEIIGKIAEVLDTSVDYLLGISDVKNLPTSKKIESYSSLYRKLDEISDTISKKHFTKEQVLMIENLLDSNKEFLSKLDINKKNIG